MLGRVVVAVVSVRRIGIGHAFGIAHVFPIAVGIVRVPVRDTVRVRNRVPVPILHDVLVVIGVRARVLVRAIVIVFGLVIVPGRGLVIGRICVIVLVWWRARRRSITNITAMTLPLARTRQCITSMRIVSLSVFVLLAFMPCFS